MFDPFWVTFKDGTRGTIEAKDESEARERGAAVIGHEALTAHVLPYPASPILFRTPGQENPCPPFCYTPEVCAGHSACPKRRACSE